jgi:ribose transport system substrate-binding protein
MTLSKSRRLYLIPVLLKAIDVLEIFQAESEPMTLEAIHRHAKISKTTAYRILKTFVHRGYLYQSPDGLYRLLHSSKKLVFGFGEMGATVPFSIEVKNSLMEAAASLGVDLLILDNCYNAGTALQNVQEFVKCGVDLVIELQVEENVAPLIAATIAAAKIPFIAVDIPHPHATYFGADNYRVGFEAGELLAAHAARIWGGKPDWVIGLEVSGAGELVQSRITGAFEGVRRSFPALPVETFVRVDGKGLRDDSRRVISDVLDRHPGGQKILIAATNDSSALGAVDAVRKHNREKQVAIVGQDCIAEAIVEMKIPGSPLIGSVSHEIASYGANIINLGLALIRGDSVSPYNYVAHRVVTPQSMGYEDDTRDLSRPI